jgi:hypothetical protein
VGADVVSEVVSDAVSLGATSGEAGGCTAFWAAIHLLPHRAQRTILRGGRRAAGTSYSASQLGQAIRMETH